MLNGLLNVVLFGGVVQVIYCVGELVECCEGNVFVYCYYWYDVVFFVVFWYYGDVVGNGLLVVRDVYWLVINKDFFLLVFWLDVEQVLYCFGMFGVDQFGDVEDFFVMQGK